VRAAIVGRPAAPRASGVFDFDAEAVPAVFGAQGEGTAVAGGACRTALVANSDAIRIASPACGQPSSHPASAARACLICPGSAG
jgi:hypothetical protein